MFIPISCNHSSKNRSIIYSLVIHMLLILWLLGFLRKTAQKNELVNASIDHPNEHNLSWASAQAKNGAPIYFMPDKPQTTSQQTTDSNAPQQTTIAHQTIPDSQQTQETEKINEPQMQSSVSSPETKETQEREQEKAEEATQEESPPAPEEKTKQPSTLFAQVARRALLQQQPNNYKTPAAQSSVQPQKSRTCAPATQTSRESAPHGLTMAQIAQGLAGYTKEEGEHTINVMGDPRRLPTEQQLKQHHYIEKLLQCLHASYATMKSKEPPIARKYPDPLLTFIIHRDGSITDVRITQSSTYPALDAFYVAWFSDAGRSFPPLPTYFQYDTYRLNWIIMMR